MREKNPYLRIGGILLAFAVCAVLESSGLGNAMNGVSGDRDVLKQRIVYWTTLCTVAYNIQLYLLGRWFTKDFYWRWKHSSMWGLSPSFTSIAIVRHLGYGVGLLLGLPLTSMFVISASLSLLLTSSMRIVASRHLGEVRPYAITTITEGSAATSYNWTVAYAGQIATTSINRRELYKDNLGRYYWTPIYLSANVSTIYVTNLTAFSMTPRCISGNVTWSCNILDCTVKHNNITSSVRRNSGGKWETGTRVENGHATVDFLRITNAKNPPVIDPSIKELYRSFGVTCRMDVGHWMVSGNLNSYDRMRFQLETSHTMERQSDVVGYVNAILSSLDIYNGTDESPERNLPIWKWILGSDEVEENAERWSEDRLARYVGYVLTEDFTYTQSYGIYARELTEESVIRANGLWIALVLSLQIISLLTVMSVYTAYRSYGVSWRSDDLTYLIPDEDDDVNDDVGRDRLLK